MSDKDIIKCYSRGFYGTCGSKFHDIKKVLTHTYLTQHWTSPDHITDVLLDIFEDEFTSVHYRSLLGYSGIDLLSKLIDVIAYKTESPNFSDELKNKFNLKEER